jgi:hypothetical protein
MRSKWLFSLALVALPAAWAAGNARPGTVNYVEGQVTLNGKPLASVQNGPTALMPGQTLAAANGKAEILLTPGTFLRFGNASAVRMVSAELSDPQVEVVRGEAMIEVDFKPKMARLDVMEQGADTQLLKAGLYKFNAEQGSVQVLEGKASVAENGHSKEIGKGKELLLADARLKPVSFNAKSNAQSEDDLYRWSSVRDSYLAQANEASARTVYVDGGWGWGGGWGLGWYWNPYYATWAWLPGDGYFWSPFGYPFFSPGYVVYAPGLRFHRYRGGFGRAGNPAFAGGRAGGITRAPGGMGGARMGGGRR